MTWQNCSLRRKLLICAAAIAVFLLLASGASVAVFYSPPFTPYIESDRFRVAMEQETAKGLHFPASHYAPIRRTDALTAQGDSFEAENGQKAMSRSMLAASLQNLIPGVYSCGNGRSPMYACRTCQGSPNEKEIRHGRVSW